MARKKRSREYEYISIDIIMGALDEEHEALERILMHYQVYIDKLSSRRMRGVNGKYYTLIDEDKKQQIETALILAVRKFSIKEDE